MSETLIKKIEDLSLNAWPTHQIQFYDGWLLRFSYFYTHRTNCVEQLGESRLPLTDKVQYVEEIYRRWGTPSIFKISPLVNPETDRYLESQGYITDHITHNMVADLQPAFLPKSDQKVTIGSFITDAWIDSLFALKGTTNVMHRQIVPHMYHAIPKETVPVSVFRDGRIIGTGLGILDRDFIGVYAIHVHPAYRRQHIAQSIVSAILAKGAQAGAKHAYLQVVDGNTAAIRLYESLGFHYVYTDYFRLKELLIPQENH